MSKKKLFVLIAIIIAAVFAAGAVYIVTSRRGTKLTENPPPVTNPAALSRANAEEPAATAQSQPEALGFRTQLMVDGQLWEGDFTRDEPIFFEDGNYTDLEGIVTFRGNNYRNNATYGTPEVEQQKLKKLWEMETGSLPKGEDTQGKGSSEWSGSGWTGQPLIVQWDESTRQVMNLYPEKKQKDGLTEAIYATMAGSVYFIDIEDGTPTRDPLYIGLPFKGAGALDPRGIPMLFVGAGDSTGTDEAGKARVFIYSLINFEKLYEFGADDPFSPREFHAYDSSALVDANTDTLLYPGENGILYTMKLNTQYDPQTGALSIHPTDEVKWTYSTHRTSEESYWWGIEDSAAIWQNYMFVADNAGNMMCLDLNTMQLVWAQDILDDTNASPVLEIDENDNKFLYIAPSLHWEKDEANTGQVSIYKLNAMTGEIVWHKPYAVHTVPDISGGVQATAVVGKNSISDLVIVPVARTPYKNAGMLVALDKYTGQQRWAFDMDWAWSSPVALYAQDGTAYLLQCDSGGTLYLLDGRTGTLLDKMKLGGKVEASPAVFGNTLVVGTRSKKIVGVSIL